MSLDTSENSGVGIKVNENCSSSIWGGLDRTDSRNLLRQFAYFLLKFLVLVAAIGKSRAETGVKLARSCSPRNFHDIGAADSCSRHNDDPFPRGFDKFGEHRGS